MGKILRDLKSGAASCDFVFFVIKTNYFCKITTGFKVV